MAAPAEATFYKRSFGKSLGSFISNFCSYSQFRIPNSEFKNSSILLPPYFFVGRFNRFTERIDVQGFLQVGKSTQVQT